jgi:DNA-binding transcriptional LysR family regulator
MELNDLAAFVSVARAGGFRDAARISGVSASSLSVAVRRLESRLELRLLNRTTRSVAPTEAGQRLLDKLTPLFGEMEAALDVLNGFRDKPTGTLKLNVPSSVAHIVLPSVLAPFLKAYPDIRVEVVVEDGFVDVLSIGCDAGIRYDERLEQDMIAIPIGPRVQRFATAAAPAYLDAHGRPEHAWPVRRGRHARLALRTRRRSAAFESCGTSDGTARRGHGSGGELRDSGRGHHPSVRRHAAAASGERRTGTDSRALVAKVFGTVSLLSGASPSASAVACFCRLSESALEAGSV